MAAFKSTSFAIAAFAVTAFAFDSVQPPVIEPVRETGGAQFREIRDAVARTIGTESFIRAGRVVPLSTVSIDADAFVTSLQPASGQAGTVRVRPEWNAHPLLQPVGTYASAGSISPSIDSVANARGTVASILNSMVVPAIDVDVHVRPAWVLAPDARLKARGIKNPTDEEIVLMIAALSGNKYR